MLLCDCDEDKVMVVEDNVLLLLPPPPFESKGVEGTEEEDDLLFLRGDAYDDKKWFKKDNKKFNNLFKDIFTTY